MVHTRQGRRDHDVRLHARAIGGQHSVMLDIKLPDINGLDFQQQLSVDNL
jgi:FixJ family two-component response regulator